MRRGPWRRMRTAALAAVAVIGLGACRVDTEVDVTVEADGSGVVAVTVTADAEVVDAVPDLAAALRLDDLTATGWVVAGPTPTLAGGEQIVLTHPFASVAEANQVLDEVSANTGPLRAMEVGVGDASGDVEWTFTGQADLSTGLAGFADEEVIALVGGIPWLDVVTERGVDSADVASVALRAVLPGTRVDDDGEPTTEPPAEIVVKPGDPAQTLSIRTLASSPEAEDAADLRDQMVRGLLIYGGVVLVGVGAWVVWRRRQVMLRQQAKAAARRLPD